MKKFLVIILFTVIVLLVGMAENQNSIQQGPVRWTELVKKIDGNTFEVRLTATIQSGWHIYAQEQPEDAIAVPTSLEFDRIPAGITLLGKVTEEGERKHHKDADLGVSAYQYAEKVVFIQKIKKKSGKVELKGSITFQACTSEKCLPPTPHKFTLIVE